MNSHSQRKRDHVAICLQDDIEHYSGNGFDDYQFIHKALPEINFHDISLATKFLGHEIGCPLFVSGMTGGFEDAESINAALAEVCQELNIPMVLGSQRSMMLDLSHDSSFSIVRSHAPDICLSANIGATEIADLRNHASILRVIDRAKANILTVHANPLQELFQPEGNTNFSGVLKGLASFRALTDIPIIVKEVGSGISYTVAKALIEIGINAIDVAGKGGTSWSAVEMKRNEQEFSEYFREWGMTTSDCLISIRALCEEHSVELYSSGGIRSAHDIAMSIALGADSVGMARPLLIAYHSNGDEGVFNLIQSLIKDVRRIMFLTGSNSCLELKNAEIVKIQRN